MTLRMGKSLLSIRLREANVSRKKLAEKLGVTPAFITMVIAGKKHLTLERAVNIAIYLDCTVLDLYEWTEVHQPKAAREQ